MKDKSRGPQPSGFSEVVISVDGAKDVISLTALEEVFRSSSDPHIRESAGRVLLDRAMGEKFRRFLAKCCHDEKNSVNQRRAVCVLQQLSKHEHNRISLVRGGFLKLLTGVIMKPVDEATARHSVTALYRLVQGNDGRKAKIAQYGALAPLKLFLTKTSTCSTELTHWSLVYCSESLVVIPSNAALNISTVLDPPTCSK
ncbi:hypothetical protein DFJ77DRAFT_320348 [Powellomyces hirtus]|nr:hypothetical protein DFJ77DRAFT_320348 [Powellomyces hirtus]